MSGEHPGEQQREVCGVSMNNQFVRTPVEEFPRIAK